MVTIIGVRFRHAGRVYSFDPGAYVIEKGDNVIVETSRGIEYGQVVTDPRLAQDSEIVQPLRSVIRKATPEDKAIYENNLEQEKQARIICEQKIQEHDLDMDLIDVEYTFDDKKILFYFTADGRVDFRELVKDLASVFHTRIELRQIGVRDETKMGGGIGICGRSYCCSTFLSDFAPVSIKMAKDQNLSLNPSKISGVCGRLMCCLRYEENTYEELTKNLPGEGDTVETPKGTGEVLHVNVLRQQVKVGITNEKGDVDISEYPVNEISIVKRSHRRKNDDTASLEEPVDEDSLKNLEKD